MSISIDLDGKILADTALKAPDIGDRLVYVVAGTHANKDQPPQYGFVVLNRPYANITLLQACESFGRMMKISVSACPYTQSLGAYPLYYGGARDRIASLDDVWCLHRKNDKMKFDSVHALGNTPYALYRGLQSSLYAIMNSPPSTYRLFVGAQRTLKAEADEAFFYSSIYAVDAQPSLLFQKPDATGEEMWEKVAACVPPHQRVSTKSFYVSWPRRFVYDVKEGDLVRETAYPSLH